MAGLISQNATTPATIAAAGPVTIVDSGGDDWLVGARDIVDQEETAYNESSLVSAVQKLLTKSPQTTIVELISHSDGDNLLTLGTWTLDKDAFANVQVDLKQLFRGKELHVVGCSTAIGTAATETLHALERCLGIPVFGTNGIVGHADLDKNGVTPEARAGVLQRAGGPFMRMIYEVTEPELMRGGPASEFSESHRRDLLQTLTPHSSQLAAEVLDLVSPRATYTFPGILSVPSASEPLDRVGERPGRLDVLLNGQLVRISLLHPRIAEGAPIEHLFRVPMDRRRALRDLMHIA